MMRAPGPTAAYSPIVKSAGRALAVLEYFADVQRAVPAADIRAHLGMPASSTTALLQSLVALGYLHYEPRNRTYVPTLRVGLLGDQVHGRSYASRRLCAMVENLSRDTGHVAVLGARSNHQAQFIHVACAGVPSHTVKRGALAPLTRTAIGWMLLSRLSDQEITRLCTRVNASEAPDKRVSPSWLTDQIQAVRENGYAFIFGTMMPGVGAISMPVPTVADEPPVVFAVGGCGAAFVARKNELVGVMRQSAERYARELAAS